MKKYQITDPDYFPKNPQKFLTALLKSYRKNKPDFIVYRDKKATLKEKRRVLKLLKKVSKKLRVKFIINESISLGREFNIGVHLTSKQFKKIKDLKRENIFTIVSTHSPEEFEYVIAQGADLATFSPIFFTPNKGEPKGVEALNLINDKIRTKLIALGGITSKSQVEKLRGKKIYGFASIRYFV